MEGQALERLIERFRTQVSRRRTLGYIAGAASAWALNACGEESSIVSTVAQDDPAQDDDTNNGGGTPDTCSEINEETGGPFPADGSNGPNVLADAAVVRSDIRANLDGSNVQPGAEFEVTVTVVDVDNDCAPIEGAAVYIWQCNADGEYSAYSGMGQSDQTDETFLRGVQVTDSNGQATFTTIYPGRYRGRATHIHAQIYADDSFNTTLKTTQFAFDEATNNTLYASSSIYDESDATTETTNTEDNVFSDGFDDQLLDISGDLTSGYVGTLVVGVNA